MLAVEKKKEEAALRIKDVWGKEVKQCTCIVLEKESWRGAGESTAKAMKDKPNEKNGRA